MEKLNSISPEVKTFLCDLINQIEYELENEAIKERDLYKNTLMELKDYIDYFFPLGYERTKALEILRKAISD